MAVGGQLADRRIEIHLGEVDIGDPAQPRQRVFEVLLGRRVAPAQQLLRVLRRLADQRAHQIQHLAGVWIAPERFQLGSDVGFVSLHRRDTLRVRNDRVGPFGGKRLAALRPAGLRDHRLALRAGAGVQRAAAAVVASDVIDRVHLGGIDQHVVLLVGDDRAWFPRSPQPLADVDELLRHFVALVVRRQAVHAEILRRQVGAAGDHVPAAASAGDLVERADDARHQIGRVGEGRQRRHDAEMRGRRCHQGRDHRGFLARDRHAALQEIVPAGVVVFADVDRVLEQHVVEAGAFDRARQVEEHIGRHPLVADVAGPRRAPGLDRGALQEPGEVEGIVAHCHVLLAGAARNSIAAPALSVFGSTRTVRCGQAPATDHNNGRRKM